MNWKQLKAIKHEEYWNFIESDLEFNPFSQIKTIDRSRFEKIHDLSSYYNDGYKEDYVVDLHEKIISAFINSTNVEDRVYALSWQHESYLFDPRMEFEKNEFDEWFIEVFANGDYNFFITSDYKNCLFADGVNMVLMYYGKNLVSYLEDHKPQMFYTYMP